jgi:prepilin-type N-terminal cleavage/methylation domain-containing protein
MPWKRSLRWNDERAFNMIEVITVSAIISILAAMSVILVARAKTQARETAALSTLNAFTTAYEAYRFRYGEYPQWGPEQTFTDPTNLVDYLMDDGLLPSVYKDNYEYFPDHNLFRGFVDDYYLRILPYDPNDVDAPPAGSYFIILVPYNFQRSSLAAIFDPLRGAVTVRARKGDTHADLSSYRLFTFKDPP